MKIIQISRVTAPIAKVFEFYNFSNSTMNAIHGIYDIEYLVGSKENFGVGTIFTASVQNAKSKRSTKVKIEILEYVPNEKIVQHISTKIGTCNSIITFTQLDKEVAINFKFDLKFKYMLCLLEPFMACTMYKFLKTESARVLKALDQNANEGSTQHFITFWGNIPMLPLWLVYLLTTLTGFILVFLINYLL